MIVETSRAELFDRYPWLTVDKTLVDRPQSDKGTSEFKSRIRAGC